MNSEQNLTREEAIAILNTPDEQLNELIERAGALRKKYKGNHVSIHLLTNARSGNCSQNCAYCAQSCRSHADIEKYKWVDDEKLYGDNTFVHDHKLSRHCIGLSGMKFSDDEIEELASKIRKMKEEGTHLCCSIGFLTKKQALMLKEAGLDRINHNLNTSRSNYPNICTTHTYEQRVNNIHMLQDLGFEICSGGTTCTRPDAAPRCFVWKNTRTPRACCNSPAPCSRCPIIWSAPSRPMPPATNCRHGPKTCAPPCRPTISST